MFLFRLEKPPQPFNSPSGLPSRNGYSFSRQKGKSPFKSSIFESPRARGVISLRLWPSFDLAAFIVALGRCSRCSPSPRSLARGQVRLSARAGAPLTEPVHTARPYHRTGMFHIPAFDALRTSAERHGAFRQHGKGLCRERNRLEKQRGCFANQKRGSFIPDHLQSAEVTVILKICSLRSVSPLLKHCY